MRARRLGPAVLAILFAVVATPAQAATTTFTYTGAEQTFVVPAEVRSIHVTVDGGGGAAGSPSAAGGYGARVRTDLAVTPGETLYIEVGGAGLPGGMPIFGGGGTGGADPLGGHVGGAGGGATDIRRLPRVAAGSEGSRVIVAGGGGGGGGGPLGGLGGNGDDGVTECTTCADQGGPGGPGTASAGGLGGDPADTAGASGEDGQPSAGGAGGAGGGGGGGGGYFGGGGGGGGDTAALNGGGGGGGGGASFVAGNATARVETGGPGPGSVWIGYGDARAEVTPSRVQFTSQMIGTVAERQVTVTNRGTIALDITAATLSGFGAGDFQVGPGCAAPVAVGASCQLVVRFAPQTHGRREAKLTLASNARFGPRSVFLAGYGRAVPKPTLTALRISPSTFKAGRKVVVSYRADVAGTAKFRVLRVKSSKGRSRLIPIGASFTRAARAGVNHFRFRPTTKLPPGRYRLRGYGSGPSRSVSAAFRIARS
jgi:hypothetical protein